MVVEHGLVDRDRDLLVGAEADGVVELPLVGDPVDVERTHADPVRGEPEADAPARELVLREEGVERARESDDVAHLAADDDPALERAAGHLDELRRAVVDDVRSGDLGGADLEADELLLPAALRLRLGLREAHGPAGLALPPRDEVGQLDLFLQVHRLCLRGQNEAVGRGVEDVKSA